MKVWRSEELEEVLSPKQYRAFRKKIIYEYMQDEETLIYWLDKLCLSYYKMIFEITEQDRKDALIVYRNYCEHLFDDYYQFECIEIEVEE